MNIILNTEITTAAHKIADQVTSTPDTLTVRFDTAGEIVEEYAAGMYHVNPADAPAYAVEFIGTRGSISREVTARDAQDALDAHAYAIAHPGTERWLAVHNHLQDLRNERARLAEAAAEITERDAFFA